MNYLMHLSSFFGIIFFLYGILRNKLATLIGGTMILFFSYYLYCAINNIPWQ